MSPPISPNVERTGWASLRDMNRYQWSAFSVAAIAWMADCMDQQLFNVARQTAVTDLLGSDGSAATVTKFATWATSIFLIGWSIGGLVFGIFGDRIGRLRTLTITVLLYSVFTGLSAASVSVWDFCAYRFLTGLGVGGVFAAAVSLIAETAPSNARPYALGLMQSFSALGNCVAAGLFIALGLLELNGYLAALRPLNAWRILFLIGLAPAALVFVARSRLQEPESWLKARDDARTGVGKRLGDFAELFREPWIRRRAIAGLILAFAGVVGLWGVGFFSLDLQQRIFRPTFDIEARELGLTGYEAANFIKSRGIIWVGITSLALNVGGFFGMNFFSWLTAHVGRRPAFAITLILAGAATANLFANMRTRGDIFWMTPLMGFFLFAIFGGYAIYLPELFPTRLRSTGTSFCYNVGRFVAASGPLALGSLESLFRDRGVAEPNRAAGVAMCSIFLLGVAVLPFLPETKGKPLPE